MTRSIERDLRFVQAPAVVWAAITTSESLANWMYPNDFQPRVGHTFSFWVPPKPGFEGLVVRCQVLTCEPPRELSFTWVVPGFLDTLVRYCLEPDGEGTRVRFTHSGFVALGGFHGAQYGWGLMHDALTQRLGEAGVQAVPAPPAPLEPVPSLEPGRSR